MVRRGWSLQFQIDFFNRFGKGRLSDLRSRYLKRKSKRKDDSNNIPPFGILRKFWPLDFFLGIFNANRLSISCRVRSDSSPSCICRHQYQCFRLNLFQVIQWHIIFLMSNWVQPFWFVVSNSSWYWPFHLHSSANICFEFLLGVDAEEDFPCKAMFTASIPGKCARR